MGALLTERDREILGALTKRVRVFSLSQIARTWWSGSAEPERVAENRLRQLAADDLLYIERAPAHPEVPLSEPAAVWNVGDPDPDFGAVSYRLQSRWSESPVLTPCVSASKKAAQRFGGHGGRPPRQVERTHDIHMAQVYLFYRLHDPSLLSSWIFEEQVKAERKLAKTKAAFGEKLPDVLIRTPSHIRVIEFGGAYGKDKLISFHRYCKEYSLSYEIW